MSSYVELEAQKQELLKKQQEVEAEMAALLREQKDNSCIPCQACNASLCKKWLAVVQESYCRGVSYDNDYRDCDYWYFICPICGEINCTDKYPLLQMCSKSQFLGVIKKEVE